MFKNRTIRFNKKVGHPVAEINKNKGAVLTTHPSLGKFRFIKVDSDNTIGFDSTDSYFTDTIVSNDKNGIFLGKLTKKGKSKLLNFLNSKK